MPNESGLAIEAVSSDAWDSLLKQFHDANYRQLAAYSSAAAARFGARSENVAIRSAGELLGLCNVRAKKLPLLPFGIAYVNGAPLVRKSRDSREDNAARMRCLDALQEEFVHRRGHVLRVVGVARPDLPQPDELNRAFLAAGFVPSKAKGRYRTMLVDVTRALADIRAALNQMWRRNLTKAERQGFDIVRGTEMALFQEYRELHRSLVTRKALTIDLGPEFFMSVQEDLSESDRIVVHLLRRDGKAVAGHIGAYHGDTAVYLLGAANEAGLKSHASYLMHWRVIEYAKERGCDWYDLGGIDPDANPGGYNFKERIGGADISAPGPYESGTEFRRWIVRTMEFLYRRIRK